MGEFEFPGVFVEEADRQPKPIEGVPTDALTPADRPRWLLWALIVVGLVLAGLGLWLRLAG